VQLATVVRRPAVLADGTYATQTAVESAPINPSMPVCTHNLRALLLVSVPITFFAVCFIHTGPLDEDAGSWKRPLRYILLGICNIFADSITWKCTTLICP